MAKTESCDSHEPLANKLDSSELLTDSGGAALLSLGMTRFLNLQKTDPDFPPPVWLGPRGKRHVRSELLRYALSKRERGAARRAAHPAHQSEAEHAAG